MESTAIKARELSIRERELRLKEKELDNRLKIAIIENISVFRDLQNPEAYVTEMFTSIKNMK